MKVSKKKTFVRTIEKDKKEKEIILQGQKLADDGKDTGGHNGFLFDGIFIIDPYKTENGFYEVIPEDYYGEAYKNWYNSL